MGEWLASKMNGEWVGGWIDEWPSGQVKEGGRERGRERWCGYESSTGQCSLGMAAQLISGAGQRCQRVAKTDFQQEMRWGTGTRRQQQAVSCWAPALLSDLCLSVEAAAEGVCGSSS
jgi:hypothetical protein